MRTYLFFTLSLFSFLGVEAQLIHRMACRGNLAGLDSLLQTTDLNVVDDRGRSLLHWAVGCRQKEVFDYLIEKGMDVNVEDYHEETPMHVAIWMKKDNYFDWLVDLQKDKNWIDHYGASLMERAVMLNSQPFIQKLLDNGVDINVTNKRGSSPLEISMRIEAKELSIWLLSLGADSTSVRTFYPRGEYFGQKSPNMEPQMFAPNFISTEESEFGSVFNANGTEFYYGVDVSGIPEIRYTELIDNEWTIPKTILSHEQYSHNDPFLSPDENRLFFISSRALDGEGEQKDIDIWYIEKQEAGWTSPINAGPNINSKRNEYYISFTNDGTMYFSSNALAPEERSRSDYDIYYSKFVDGEFQKAVALGDSINTNAYEADVFVAPDESYLIFCATRPDGLGRGDLYISFHHEDGHWSKAVNMGAPINSKFHELCPFVSADGKYLFYTSNQDIFWIDAEIIQEIRDRVSK